MVPEFCQELVYEYDPDIFPQVLGTLLPIWLVRVLQGLDVADPKFYLNAANPNLMVPLRYSWFMPQIYSTMKGMLALFQFSSYISSI